jgi:hypothetical protein
MFCFFGRVFTTSLCRRRSRTVINNFIWVNLVSVGDTIRANDFNGIVEPEADDLVELQER